MAKDTVVITQSGQKYRTLVTDIGDAKIARAALIGKKVNVIEAAVGDGNGAYYLPTADMTALKNEKWRGPIQAKAINPDSKNMVDVKFKLDGTVGGFTIREAGLFDEDGDLIAVCNMPDTEKVAILDGIASTLTILMHTVFTNIEAVTFQVDPRVDVVTQAELEQAIELAVKPLVTGTELAERLEPLEPYHELAQITHGLGTYPQVLLGGLQWGAGMGGAGEGPAGGTDMDNLPVRVRYHSRQSLTLYTTQAAARPGIVKQLHGGGREWAMTFEGDELSSLYILLTGEG